MAPRENDVSERLVECGFSKRFILTSKPEAATVYPYGWPSVLVAVDSRLDLRGNNVAFFPSAAPA